MASIPIVLGAVALAWLIRNELRHRGSGTAWTAGPTEHVHTTLLGNDLNGTFDGCGFDSGGGDAGGC